MKYCRFCGTAGCRDCKRMVRKLLGETNDIRVIQRELYRKYYSRQQLLERKLESLHRLLIER